MKKEYFKTNKIKKIFSIILLIADNKILFHYLTLVII